MEAMLNLKELSTNEEITTIVEMTDSEIRSAVKKGWTLRAVFEATRNVDRYSSEKEAPTLFGVYVLPTDQVVKSVVADLEETENKLSEETAKRYAVERQLKEASTALFEAQQRNAKLVAAAAQKEDDEVE